MPTDVSRPDARSTDAAVIQLMMSGIPGGAVHAASSGWPGVMRWWFVIEPTSGERLARTWTKDHRLFGPKPCRSCIMEALSAQEAVI